MTTSLRLRRSTGPTPDVHTRFRYARSVFAKTIRDSRRTTIIVAVLLETTLLFWIRDNLFLNVLMLLWPLDIVRVWQRGG